MPVAWGIAFAGPTRVAVLALYAFLSVLVTATPCSAVQVSMSRWNGAPEYNSARAHLHSPVPNLYAYCGGDPVNRTDTSGLDWDWVESDQKWKWVAGKGELSDVEAPDWATPQWTPAQINETVPPHHLSTATAIFYNMHGKNAGNFNDERASDQLAQLVGQGKSFSARDAVILNKFFTLNKYGTGEQGLAAYNTWQQAEYDRITQNNSAIHPEVSVNWTGPSPAKVGRGVLEFVIENSPVYAMLNVSVPNPNRSRTGTVIAVAAVVLAIIPMERLFVDGGEKVLKGAYEVVGGHHVHAKAAFRGHPSYDPQRGFSISQEYMEANGLNHARMTAKQRELFDALAVSGKPNTLIEQSRIAEEALVAGGASREEARLLVQESVDDLVSQGVVAPTRIPWNSP